MCHSPLTANTAFSFFAGVCLYARFTCFQAHTLYKVRSFHAPSTISLFALERRQVMVCSHHTQTTSLPRTVFPHPFRRSKNRCCVVFCIHRHFDACATHFTLFLLIRSRLLPLLMPPLHNTLSRSTDKKFFGDFCYFYLLIKYNHCRLSLSSV